MAREKALKALPWAPQGPWLEERGSQKEALASRPHG